MTHYAKKTAIAAACLGVPGASGLKVKKANTEGKLVPVSALEVLMGKASNQAVQGKLRENTFDGIMSMYQYEAGGEAAKAMNVGQRVSGDFKKDPKTAVTICYMLNGPADPPIKIEVYQENNTNGQKYPRNWEVGEGDIMREGKTVQVYNPLGPSKRKKKELSAKFPASGRPHWKTGECTFTAYDPAPVWFQRTTYDRKVSYFGDPMTAADVWNPDQEVIVSDSKSKQSRVKSAYVNYYNTDNPNTFAVIPRRLKNHEDIVKENAFYRVPVFFAAREDPYQPRNKLGNLALNMEQFAAVANSRFGLHLPPTDASKVAREFLDAQYLADASLVPSYVVAGPARLLQPENIDGDRYDKYIYVAHAWGVNLEGSHTPDYKVFVDPNSQVHGKGTALTPAYTDIVAEKTELIFAAARMAAKQEVKDARLRLNRFGLGSGGA
jgi:hypothetical protein